MSVSKIESVAARQRGAYDFESHYTDLCTLQNVCPIPAVKASLGEHVLDINGDRIRANDWIPILKSVSINKTLESVGFRSFFQQLIDEQEGKNYRRKIPAIRSKEITYRICKSLRECLLVTPCLACVELQGLPLRQRDMASLSKGIHGNHTLRHLSLEHSRIGDEGLETLSKGLRNNPTVHSINLTGCSLSSSGAETLAKLIKHQAMRRHSEAWQDSLRYRRPDLDRQAGIRRITANTNPMMGDAAAKMLAEALKDDLWLKALDLQQCGLTDAGGQALLDTLKYNTCIVVLDIRQNPMTNHAIIKSIIEHLTVNSCGNETEYKWIKAESLQDPSKLKTKKKRTKALASSFGKRATVRTPVNSSSSLQQQQQHGHRSSSSSKSCTPTRALQPFTGASTDVKPGLPWRTALRANRFKGYPPEESPSRFHEDGVTVLEGEKTKLRINASADEDYSDDSSPECTRRVIRGTLSDTDISSRKDMKAAQVELEMLRRKLRDERLSRAAQDELIISLTLENSHLKQDLDEQRSKQSILDDDAVLDSIERSFHQFHQFLELLRHAGLGELISLSGIDESSMPFSIAPNTSNMSKHERLANFTTSNLNSSTEVNHMKKRSISKEEEEEEESGGGGGCDPPAEPVFSTQFQYMVQQQQRNLRKDITNNAQPPSTGNKFDELYSKVLEESEVAINIQSSNNEKINSDAASQHSKHGVTMQIEDLQTATMSARKTHDEADNVEEDDHVDDDDISEELEQFENSDNDSCE